MELKSILSKDQVNQFFKDGFLKIESFYDKQKDIEPIQYHIYCIIGLLLKKYNIDFQQLPYSSLDFDSGYQELIAADRKIGGEVYDALKHVPSFLRLVCNEKHDAIVAQLRQTTLPGIANGGYGIRIDNPKEEKYRAGWHQDYTSQFRSLDGIVFWSPLIKITEELGPVQLCTGSHKDGLVPVHAQDPRYPDKSGAYGLVFKDEANLVRRYPIAAPLSEPGDLILIDYQTIHASGYNNSNRSRWSMQMRYFNYEEPTGIRIGWKGSFAAGNAIKEIHPELMF
ncbi:phytanoyl-CoA dioxygenase family protein [Paenibacillus aestuarii]|uniref:Phytanoyl-CoA dioxygenase family protein n=1 Tax=Paenibacillus aestuarii TaxID=516965 RepID=A0ABW0K7V6_9BACL|nr:phytanoyl-CoA dioxygenase family protein [Paenibacillus aestuarii]